MCGGAYTPNPVLSVSRSLLGLIFRVRDSEESVGFVEFEEVCQLKSQIWNAEGPQPVLWRL